MAELRIPIQDRSDDLALEFGVVVEQAVQREQLTETEGAIVREVGMRLLLDGCRTFGEAEDRLEAAGPRGQREILDSARTAIGMETVDDEQARFRFEATQRGLQKQRFSDDQGRTLQGCHAAGCKAMPTHPGGALRPVADRVWWCDQHRDQAGPKDHLPPEPKYVLGPNFNPIPVGEERERLESEERERLEAQAEKNRQRRAEAEAISKVRDRYEEEAVISVGGLRMRRDGRLVQ